MSPTPTGRHRNRVRAPLGTAQIVGRPLLAAAVAATGVALTATGVYAALNATAFNSTAQATGSGTLRLTLADNGAGFAQAVSALAPGDVVNRYVSLTNGGTLEGRALTLAVADPVGSRLTTDATSGLRVTVSSCPTAWTATSGTCSTTPTTLTAASGVPLATLKTTASTLLAGAVPVGGAVHLQLALALPDQSETTVNGVLPTGTIQGLSASLTWTFAETQRTPTTTTS